MRLQSINQSSLSRPNIQFQRKLSPKDLAVRKVVGIHLTAAKIHKTPQYIYEIIIKQYGGNPLSSDPKQLRLQAVKVLKRDFYKQEITTLESLYTKMQLRLKTLCYGLVFS